ncbi:hypothetical protein BHM03_00026367 [Ensete ventricosum]|nr:hypothetical protein BHM03_00026367 [Ensete ventricosum]
MNRTCFRNIGESSSFVKYMVPPRSSLLADPNPHKPPLLSPHDSLKTRITVQDRASTLSRTHPWRLHKILRGPSRNRISDHPRTTTRASPHPQRRSSALEPGGGHLKGPQQQPRHLGHKHTPKKREGRKEGQRPEVSVCQRLLSVTVEKLDEKTHPRKPDPTVRTVVTHAAAAAAAAAAARKGEMPFSWLPRRDKVWLTVRGAHGTYLHERVRPHRASLFKVSAGSFRFRSRKLATPSLPLHPTSRRQPGSRNTYLHNTTRISITLHDAGTHRRTSQRQPGPQGPYLLSVIAPRRQFQGERSRFLFLLPSPRAPSPPSPLLIAPRLHRHPPSQISETARISRKAGVRCPSPGRGNHWRRQ